MITPLAPPFPRACSLILLALALVFPALPAAAETHSILLHAEAGREAVASYDDLSGVITIARNLGGAQPEYRYVSIRRYPRFDGRFLRAVDLTAEQGSDLVLPAFAANKLLILWSRDFNSETQVPEEFAIGAGPMAVAGAQIDGAGFAELLVMAGASASWELHAWDPETRATLFPPAIYPPAYARQELLGFETVGRVRGGVDPWLGILRAGKSPAEGTVLEVIQRNPAPAYGAGNASRRGSLAIPFTRLRGGHPNGSAQPGWFLAWSPGLASIALAQAGAEGTEVHPLAGPVLDVQFTTADRDEILAVFEDGSVGVHMLVPGQPLRLRQTIPAPRDRRFISAVGANGRLVLLDGDSDHGIHQFQIFTNGPAGYARSVGGAWPSPKRFATEPTVAVYSGDPFGSLLPVTTETLVAGDWASSVKITGSRISAEVETFRDPQRGLGDPKPTILEPTSLSPLGVFALGNQWEPSSSLFYEGPPQAFGPALVVPDPPPGRYNRTLQVQLQAGPGVTPHYRVNGGIWRSDRAPIWLAQTATIEFYARRSSGELGSIQSAEYRIDQLAGEDGDGDGVPDAIEALAGTDPAHPDSDGDGASDFKELAGASDPLNPSSLPHDSIGGFDEITVQIVWDDEQSRALPALDQPYRFSDLADPDPDGTSVVKLPGLHKSSNVTLKRGLMSGRLWLPMGYRLSRMGDSRVDAGPSLVCLAGLEFPAPPVVPIDLTGDDPLEAWRSSVRAELARKGSTPQELTIGPASAMAAVLFDHWFGTRLVALGRLSQLDNRPGLSLAPSSPDAGTLDPEDVRSIESPISPSQRGYRVTSVMAGLNSEVVRGAGSRVLREVAEAFFAQAIEAELGSAPLPPPASTMRRWISGAPLPAGYALPHSQSTVIALRNQVLGSITPRPERTLNGVLSEEDDTLIVWAGAERFALLAHGGGRYRPSGAGMLIPGATVRVRGYSDVNRNHPAMAQALEVAEFELSGLPVVLADDGDSDGMSDAWERWFLGTVGATADGDEDGDGFLNREEYVGGTDPANALSMPAGGVSMPRQIVLTLGAGTGAALEWLGSAATAYQVWGSADLETWRLVAGQPQHLGGGRFRIPIEIASPREFYQIRLAAGKP